MERTTDGLPIVRYPVTLTSQEAATLIARAHSAGVDYEELLREIVCQSLFGATPPLSLPPKPRSATLAREIGEIVVTEDEELDVPPSLLSDEGLVACQDAQHERDRGQFEKRRHEWQHSAGGQ